MNINKHIRGVRFSFTFISLAVLLAATSLAAIANAQNPETETSDTGSEAATTTIDSGDSDTPTPALSEDAQTHIRTLANSMSGRMQEANAHLTNISERAQTRIDIMAERDMDTALARLHLDNAGSALADADATLATANNLVNALVVADDPLASWPELQSSFINTKTKLQTAHQSLQNVVTALQREMKRGSDTQNTGTTSPQQLPTTTDTATDTATSSVSTSTPTATTSEQ